MREKSSSDRQKERHLPPDTHWHMRLVSFFDDTTKWKRRFHVFEELDVLSKGLAVGGREYLDDNA